MVWYKRDGDYLWTITVWVSVVSKKRSKNSTKPVKTHTAPQYFLSKQQRTLLLILILGFSFFSRIIRLHVPERYVFDEVYHAVTAKLIARNDLRAFEWWNPPPEPETAVDWLHPPLAKYTQAASMLIFGETSFGWRLSSVVFGVGVIWLTYRLAALVFDNEEVGLLAAGLASLDGLLLVQSRIAMNDIHVTFFILLALFAYWRYRLSGLTTNWKTDTFKKITLVGVAAGLAMASKWSGLFVLVIICCYEGFDLLQYLLQTLNARVQTRERQLRVLFKTAGLLMVSLAIIPILVYVASYTPMFLQGKSLFCFQKNSIQGECYFERFVDKNKVTTWEGYISHFAMLHRQIWWYQTHLTATHPFQSRPWQWFFDLRPVWFHVDYLSDQPRTSNEKQMLIANIYSQGNPAVFWLGGASVIFTTILLVTTSLKKHFPQIAVLSQQEVRSLFFVVFSYGMVWLPWVASPRIMFFYHYTPAVPLLCMVLAYWLYQMMRSQNELVRVAGKAAVLACVVVFGLWYPQWTALPVPRWFADAIYYRLPSWK